MIESTELEYLLSRLRHQFPEGVTTIGYCSTGCGKPARGSGVCADCLIADMVKLGADKYVLLALQSALTQRVRLSAEIDDLCEKVAS